MRRANGMGSLDRLRPGGGTPGSFDSMDGIKGRRCYHVVTWRRHNRSFLSSGKKVFVLI